MYKLLIVDDEPEIVDWLSDLFREFKPYELEVFTSYSGRDALALLDRLKIDVVLTDIRMPGVNGLQLLERIRENWPKSRVIFLTGYKDFEYVYTAIQQQGVRYLLKTEADEKILDAVRDSIYELEESLRNTEIINKARQQIQAVLPSMQKEFLNDWIDGFTTGITQEKLDELDIPLKMDVPVMLFIGHLDNLKISQSLSQKYEYFFAVRQLVEENLPEYVKSIHVVHDRCFQIWMIQPSTRVSHGTADPAWDRMLACIKGILEYVQDSCNKTLARTISFAVDSKPFYSSLLPEKYYQLRQLLACRIGVGTEMILYDAAAAEKDADPHGRKGNAAAVHKPVSSLGLLERYLELDQREEYFKVLHELCGNLKEKASKNYNPSLEIYYNISMILLGFINRNNITEKLAFRIGLYKLTRADEHATWSDAAQYLIDLSGIIFETLNNEEERRAKDVIDRIRHYITSNMKEDLNLAKLSDMVYFNPSYLSRLFKQVTGTNLSDYILKVRIEKAKELLKDGSLKVNEISAAVGYDSPHSFARVFRNATGISPLEFRASHVNKCLGGES